MEINNTVHEIIFSYEFKFDAFLIQLTCSIFGCESCDCEFSTRDGPTWVIGTDLSWLIGTASGVAALIVKIPSDERVDETVSGL